VTADAAGRQLHFVGHMCGGTDHELDRICPRLEASMGWLGVRNQARRRSPFATSTPSSRETLHLHVLPTLGCMNLRGLTPTRMGTLLASKAADVPGARSVQIIHVTLRTMPSEATRETPLVGLVDRRPRPKC
jgi:hypothetical protein